jgi:hypothetical protein
MARRVSGLLALDVATVSGWAYGAPGERPLYGRYRAGKPPHEGGQILAAFRGWLNWRLAEWRPEWIVFEAPYVPHPRSPIPVDINVVRRLFAMCGIVEMTAHEHGIRCREEQSNVICKFFTGNGSWGGRANKKAATQKMAAVYGFPGVSEDEADALALFVYAEAVLFRTRRSAGPLFAT